MTVNGGEAISYPPNYRTSTAKKRGKVSAFVPGHGEGRYGYRSARRSIQHQKWNCKVLSNYNVATFFKELVLELPPGEDVGFRAGGFYSNRMPAPHRDYRNFDIKAEDAKTALEAPGIILTYGTMSRS